jgi:glycosyltransferase involved in cell wall biosynthesis
MANGVPGIVLTGFLSGDPLKEIYSNAGVFILPSYYEGLPIVLLEAMSFGLKCVVSDIPANREVQLSPDRYIKPGDIETMSQKLAEFMRQPLTVEERAAKIERVAREYNWNEIAQRTLEVYLEVEGRPSAG